MSLSPDTPAPPGVTGGSKMSRRDWLKTALAAGFAAASGAALTSAQAKPTGGKGGGPAPSTPMAIPAGYQASLQLQGVKGGAFQIDGWAAEVVRPTSLADLGGPSGSFRVRKRLDVATAELMQRAQAGETSQTGKLVVRRDGKVWLSVTFWDVTLTRVVSSGNTGGADVESVEFSYADADWRDHSAAAA